MILTDKEARAEVLTLAGASPCNKRKVGALILDANGRVLGKGWNYNTADEQGCNCEDTKGNTIDSVVHAEVAAIKAIPDILISNILPLTIYVTHTPCKACREAIEAAQIKNIVVVEEFMKFDTNKLRYDLIPPSALEALATVLTYGAKKYKPDNWKNVDNPERYIGAAMRHFEAYRSGEWLDPESGKPHLWHVMTNIAFLTELEYMPHD